MKAGYLTSEFWLSVLVIACATALLVLDKITSDNWMIAAGLNGAGYAVARGVAKINPPKD